MIRLGTLFTGIGAIEQSLKRLNLEHEIVFACDNGDIEIGIDIENEGTVGLISYIRTDSKRISEEAKEKSKEYVL